MGPNYLVNNDWAGNLNGQSFDDVLFSGTTFTASLSTSGTGTASVTSTTGVAYFSTLVASAVTGSASLARTTVRPLSVAAVNSVSLLRAPNRNLLINGASVARLVRNPLKVLTATGSNNTTVHKTILLTLKANATLLLWSFLHRCGISAFSTISAERNWNNFYNATGWTDEATNNWSYSVRQRIYGCS